MRVLVVCRYKEKLAGHAAPFVMAQATAIAKELRNMQNDGMSRADALNEPLALNDETQVELFRLRGNYWKQWKSLREKIKEFKPDVIHAHYGLSCLVANMATRCVPVVSTYHGSDINIAKVRSFSKIAMWMSAWNIFVSQRNVNLAKPSKCWSLIPCGVELSEEQLMTREEARRTLGWGMEEKKVLFAGAFDNAVKDPALALQVIGELKLEIGDLELLELKGYMREQVNTLMCAVDALLMTSKTEGSPQVIKEAMACGCPIVSVDVGDVKERVADMEGCYVVPIGDRSLVIGNLAESLKKAIAFEGKTNGCERIIEDGLTNKLVAKRIIKIYEDILR